MSAARRKSVTDMTVGDPMKLILSFVVPLLGGMLFQQLYSCVDTLIVGRFLGVSELAGVGSTGSINFLIVGFCMGVCSGFAIPISQQFGAKKYSEMRRYLVHSIYLSIVFAVICTLLSVSLSFSSAFRPSFFITSARVQSARSVIRRCRSCF